MAKKNVLKIQQGPFSNLRYFHTNFQIALNNGMVEEISADRAKNHVSQLGTTGTEIVQALGARSAELGLRKIQMSMYQLTLEKYTAFSWKPIEAAVQEIIREKCKIDFSIVSADLKTASARLIEFALK